MTQPAADTRHTVDNLINRAERGLTGDEAARLRQGIAELRTRAEKAEAALAAMNQGEEPHTDERTVPTPAQWIWHWNRATPARRLEVAAALIDASERADRCFIENHKNALPTLRQRTVAAEAALDAVRVITQRMEDWDSNIPSTRRWVTDLRAALDAHTNPKDQPT